MPRNRFKSAILLTLLILAYTNAEKAVDDIDIEVDNADDITVEVEDDSDSQYRSPTPSGSYYFADHFDDPKTLQSKWVKSEAKKEDTPEELAVYDGKWKIGQVERESLKGDMGLILESQARHAAIAAALRQPFYFNKNPFIVQYEVLFPEAFECGGAYLKLLSHVPEMKDLKKFRNSSPYTIMFGPDKCGSEHKLHFIFRHKNPFNGTMTEKHLMKPKERLEEHYKDKLPHLYALFLYPDNTFTIKVDGKIFKEGSLLEDFDPPVNPPQEIDDPNDHKPKDWDESEKIPDPDARKPEDWDEEAPEYISDSTATKPEGWLDDEPETIPDTDALRPDDWDEEIDGEWDLPSKSNPACVDVPGCGEWTPPLIKNPAYKGKWSPPLVPNPNYMGRWKPRKIPNPDFFQDKDPFGMTPISAVGFELWSMAKEIHFDNLLITDDPSVAEQWAQETFHLKRRKLEKSSKTLWTRMMRSMNYKPGWWALYFVYISIPLTLYVWYLYRRAKEESVVTRIMNYTNERPWLYAIYVVAIGLPLVLIFVFCCGSDDRARKAAEAKKSDSLQPDDEEPEDEDDEDIQGSQETEAERPPPVVTRASKSDLEVQEEDIGQESPLENEAGGDVPRSPKKRRSRKD